MVPMFTDTIKRNRRNRSQPLAVNGYKPPNQHAARDLMQRRVFFASSGGCSGTAARLSPGSGGIPYGKGSNESEQQQGKRGWLGNVHQIDVPQGASAVE